MKSFRIGFLTAAALLGLSQVASAADMAVKAPVMAPIPTWAGWYIGANAGGVWGDTDPGFTINDTVGNYYTFGAGQFSNLSWVMSTGSNFSNSGFTAGGQVGYNWQFGSTVFGLEADFNYFNPKGSRTVVSTLPANAGCTNGACSPFAISDASSSNWLATVRGRVGVVTWNTVLLYATAGIAVADMKYSAAYADATTSPPQVSAALRSSYASSGTGWGPVLGAGFEWMFAPKWSLKAEYLWLELKGLEGSTRAVATAGSPTAFFSVFNYSPIFTESIVRGGINYHF